MGLKVSKRHGKVIEVFNSIIYLVSNYLAHKALITNKRLDVHFIKNLRIMYPLSVIKVLDVIFFRLLHE